MKTTQSYSGGFIHEQYYQLWADYYLKFFDAYEEKGIKFWGVTVQNEPGTGLFGSPINSNAWTASQLVLAPIKFVLNVALNLWVPD